MGENINALGQPIGRAVPDWKVCKPPPREVTQGQYCRIEPIHMDAHASDLFSAFGQDTNNRIWTYLPYGPFDNEADFRSWMEGACFGDDPLFHAIIDGQTDKAIGVASYLRIDAANGVIEVGNINYSPLLQQTRAATEVMYLMMHRVFSDLGYRRYEWKCDALNTPSRKAAERLGFSYDGLFQQAIMYKGRNRDTAWFSILDGDWPGLKTAYLEWLDADNFDAAGQQKTRLAELISIHRTTKHRMVK
ncbi:MAG: GNAT family N-acetyltransferase [Rhizobiaceae bacterium]|nr:GNAT family N-acetyltransferase [Rhizobiaceae bacterium]